MGSWKLKTGWLRRLYDWVLGWADSAFGTIALGTLSTIEAVFFPIPPDPLLMALTLARPTRGMYYAAICSVTSVLGGIGGYAVGKWAYEAVGARIIASLGYVEAFQALQAQFTEYTFWAIMVAGFTPLPYKVFTIAAGAMSMALLPFAAASFVGRGARFFLVAALVAWGGPRIESNLKRYIDALGWTLVGLVVVAYLALRG